MRPCARQFDPRRLPLAMTCAFALCAAPLRAQSSVSLVAPGSVWKYLDDGSQPVPAWTQVAFDDSVWAQGPAQLGYGDGDESTVVGFGPDANAKFVTTYFRHAFDVPNPGQYVVATLRLLRDDGAVVWLNGVEVARSNMPSGAASSSTLASSAIAGAEEDTYYWFDVPAALFNAGPNVLAVEVHQSSTSSSDVSFDADLRAGTGPSVVRGPYLQSATPNSVVVRWRTDLATNSRVLWGPAPGQLTSSTVDPTSTTEHEVLLSDLTPQSVVAYAVGSSAGNLVGDDADHVFRTPPLVGSTDPMRIWMLGDCGTANANAAAVRDAYATFTGAQPTDLWFLMGDNAYDMGDDAEYQAAVFETYPAMLRTTPLWTVRGNHDMSLSTYADAFTLPDSGEAGGEPSGTESYYSFDRGNVHFVCLDSFGSSRAVGAPMHTWLSADLAANLQPWLIAVWHHPPYTKGSHDSDTEIELVEMRANFLPLLEAHGVDMVVCGHSHSYERTYLLDGHYGASGTLTSSMVLDAGDGREDGTGAYVKQSGPNHGTVYAVAGSAGKTGGGPLNHPAMFVSLNALGSLVLDVSGGRLDGWFVRSNGVVADRFTLLASGYLGSYCTPKVSSQLCIPTIASAGLPSASSTLAFDVTASEIVNGANGILFYGSQPKKSPLLGGTLCVGGTIKRLPPQNSGGAVPCAGAYSYDFNAHIQSGSNPQLVPGVEVFAQYWYRDPADPWGFGSGFSDGLRFTILP